MERSDLPLTALKAFEAAARHGNFTQAGMELGVTHGAISQQIKQLEKTIGQALFLRQNRGVRLTESGERLLPVLTDAFDRIASRVESLSTAEGGLRVTATPSFLSGWLIPRLESFQSVLPNKELRLLPTLAFLDLGTDEADIGIRCGVPPWPGLEAEFLLPIHMSPLCSAALLAGEDRVTLPQDLLRLPLIHADAGTHPTGEEWRLWLTAAGVGAIPELTGPSFRDPALAIQAAISGLGVAIGYQEIFGPEVGEGRLIQPFELAVRHPFSYYLVYHRGRAAEPDIKAFRDWIKLAAQGFGD